MREEGAVSFWAGHAASPESLENVMRVEYSEDGDERGSAFGRGFALEAYDDDCREAERFATTPATLVEALEGFSYDAIVTPLFVALAGNTLQPGENCCVLLYNYRHAGSMTHWEGDGVSLRFIGNVRFR